MCIPSVTAMNRLLDIHAYTCTFINITSPIPEGIADNIFPVYIYIYMYICIHIHVFTQAYIRTYSFMYNLIDIHAYHQSLQ
jgi:hypothetical protein